jgi:hypothetical protein
MTERKESLRGAPLRAALEDVLRKGGALRYASDVSGIGVAAMACHHLGCAEAAPVFLSEAAATHQRFLACQYPETPIFTDIMLRKFGPRGITGPAFLGPAGFCGHVRGVTEVREVAPGSVDVYVAPLLAVGAPGAGESGGVFATVLKTVLVLLPSVAILGFAGKPGQAWRDLLEKSSRYDVSFGALNPGSYHGVPWASLVEFAVLVRKPEVKSDPTGAAERAFALARRLRPDSPMKWNEYLADKGVPVERAAPAAPRPVATPCRGRAAGAARSASCARCAGCGSDGDAECDCVPAEVCDGCGERACPRESLSARCAVHTCPCPCGETGAVCQHREHLRHVVAQLRDKRKKYLRAWQKVKKDPKLKRPPNFGELAAARGLRIPRAVADDVRLRLFLKIQSEAQNLLTPEVLCDLTPDLRQAHLRVRSDGKALRLMQPCTKIFAPHAGVFLNAEQCLALAGVTLLDMDPRNQKKVHEDADMAYAWAGNTVSPHALGALILAASAVSAGN